MSAEQQRLKENKENAMRFYQLLVGDHDYEAAGKLVGDEYIQHNPYILDGYDALVDAMKTHPLWKDRPKWKINMVYPVAEGDLVYFQVVLPPIREGQRATVWERFRFNSDGKIVEHWDAFQTLDMSLSEVVNDAALY